MFKRKERKSDQGVQLGQDVGVWKLVDLVLEKTRRLWNQSIRFPLVLPHEFAFSISSISTTSEQRKKKKC
jgi:hypothetical protein